MAQEKKHSLSGQRFGALKKYISANTESAKDLSGKVTESGQKDIQDARSKREDSQSEAFGSTYTPENQEKIGGLYNKQKESFKEKSDTISNVFNPDTKDIQLDKYNQSKLATGEGDKTGSDIWKEYGDTKVAKFEYNPYEMTKAKRQSNQIGTEGGRFSLLKQRFGQNAELPAYSKGQQRLDQLLLQSQGQKLKDTQQLLSKGRVEEEANQRRLKSDVISSFGGTRIQDGQPTNVIGELGNQAQDIRNRVRDIDVVGQTSNLESDFQNRLKIKTGDIKEERDNITTEIQQDNLSENTAKKLGIPKNDRYGFQTYGASTEGIQQYNPELGSILSDEEKQRYLALSSLTGITPEQMLNIDNSSDMSEKDQYTGLSKNILENKDQFERDIAPLDKDIDTAVSLKLSEKEMENAWLNYRTNPDLAKKAITNLFNTTSAQSIKDFMKDLDLNERDKYFSETLETRTPIQLVGYILNLSRAMSGKGNFAKGNPNPSYMNAGYSKFSNLLKNRNALLNKYSINKNNIKGESIRTTEPIGSSHIF